MNRILLFSCLLSLFLFAPCSLRAQKKDIAQAKEWVKKKQNLDKAQQSMEALLKDSSNRTNEKIYLVLFEAVKGQYEQGNEQLYLKQKCDTAQLFNNALRMFQVLESLDSLDAMPDGKGRVKPKYRADHARY